MITKISLLEDDLTKLKCDELQLHESIPRIIKDKETLDDAQLTLQTNLNSRGKSF